MGLRFSLNKKSFQFLTTARLSSFENALKNPFETQKNTFSKINAQASKKTSPLETPDEKSQKLWAANILHNSKIDWTSASLFKPSFHGDSPTKSIEQTAPFLHDFLVTDTGSLNSTSGLAYYESLAAQLLEATDLEIIQLKNPNYFLSLLDFITAHRTQIHRHVRNPLVRKVLIEAPVLWNLIWPNLKLISCWNTAEYLPAAQRLQKIFPEIWFQGTGLTSENLDLTIPWMQARGQVPLLEDIYFEFESATGQSFLLHELKENQTYSLFITTAEGHRRLGTGDLIKVTHFFEKTPCFEYAGRKEPFCNMTGERLTENALIQNLGSLFPKGSFCCVLPTEKGPKPRYVIVIDEKQSRIDPYQIEKLLLQIRDYKLARDLEQMNTSQVLFVKDLRTKYANFMGTDVAIKSADLELALLTDLTQAEKFLAELTSESSLQI